MDLINGKEKNIKINFTKMTMSTNNCESMASYFPNSYMASDMHGHYPGNDPMDGGQQMHHYSQNPNQGNLPYPRFPPYDRMGYYNQNMEPTGYSRPESPSNQVMSQPNGTQLGTQTTNHHGQQQPVVYASCKLQAAVGGIGMGADSGSPPLEPMSGHHMNTQMTIPHHMGHTQGQVSITISSDIRIDLILS